MDVKNLRERIVQKKGSMVPGGMAVTAAQWMIRAEPVLFRGWNADLMLQSPDQSEEFQIAVHTSTIHDKELEMLSEVAKEFQFNYYIDALPMTDQRAPMILIRCRMNPGVKN